MSIVALLTDGTKMMDVIYQVEVPTYFVKYVSLSVHAFDSSDLNTQIYVGLATIERSYFNNISTE